MSIVMNQETPHYGKHCGGREGKESQQAEWEHIGSKDGGGEYKYAVKLSNALNIFE